MHAWEQVQQTLDYIEDHLKEDIRIETLAQQVSLSQFYYQRLFSRLVKKSVLEYVRLRRLSKASKELLKDDRRILDIALEFGFSSHEHFTRAFREAFGMTPTKYRKHPTALNRMTKPDLTLHYTLVDEGVPLITDGIVLEINRQRLDSPILFLGFETEEPVSVLQSLGAGSGVDPLDALWHKFHDEKTALALNENAPELGVCYAGQQKDTFRYFAGAEALPGTPSTDCMEWTLSQGEYVVCSIEAENFDALVMDALYKAQSYVYRIYLPNHHLRVNEFCVERYASHTPETTTMELWLKLME